MNVAEQSKIFISDLETRNRNRAKPNTIKAYQCHLRRRILPELGLMDLATFDNGAMRKFVTGLSKEDLKPATIVNIVNCLKGIIGSALDGNGNELYPRKWNNDFIDLPIVVQRDQKRSTIDREALQESISRAQGMYKPLYTILAATGLRISECLALRGGTDDGKGSFVIREQRMIVIRDQVQYGQFVSPKTAAGFRQVDLSPEIMPVLNELPTGLFFKGIELRKAEGVCKDDGIPGFHSLRRFRITHLREKGTPEEILKFWVGHATGQDITDRYSTLAQDISLRKEWADKAGLGFRIL